MTKTRRFTQEQIVQILEEAKAGAAGVAEIARRYSISQWTVYRWRKRYGGAGRGGPTRIEELERENARLKKLLAERVLEIEIMREDLDKSGRGS